MVAATRSLATHNDNTDDAIASNENTFYTAEKLNELKAHFTALQRLALTQAEQLPAKVAEQLLSLMPGADNHIIPSTALVQLHAKQSHTLKAYTPFIDNHGMYYMPLDDLACYQVVIHRVDVAQEEAGSVLIISGDMGQVQNCCGEFINLQGFINVPDKEAEELYYKLSTSIDKMVLTTAAHSAITLDDNWGFLNKLTENDLLNTPELNYQLFHLLPEKHLLFQLQLPKKSFMQQNNHFNLRINLSRYLNVKNLTSESFKFNVFPFFNLHLVSAEPLLATNNQQKYPLKLPENHTLFKPKTCEIQSEFGWTKKTLPQLTDVVIDKDNTAYYWVENSLVENTPQLMLNCPKGEQKWLVSSELWAYQSDLPWRKGASLNLRPLCKEDKIKQSIDSYLSIEKLQQTQADIRMLTSPTKPLNLDNLTLKMLVHKQFKQSIESLVSLDNFKDYLKQYELENTHSNFVEGIVDLSFNEKMAYEQGGFMRLYILVLKLHQPCYPSEGLAFAFMTAVFQLLRSRIPFTAKFELQAVSNLNSPHWNWQWQQ